MSEASGPAGVCASLLIVTPPVEIRVLSGQLGQLVIFSGDPLKSAELELADFILP